MCDIINKNNRLNSFTEFNTFKLLEVTELLDEKVYEQRRVRRLVLKERIILTFIIKLKNDISYVVLSLLFGGIAPLNCKTIFYEMLDILAVVLKPAIVVLDMQQVLKNTPLCFKEF